MFLRRQGAAFGNGHQPGHLVLVFVVGRPLGIGHLHEKIAIYALRQIGGIEAVDNPMLESREDDLRWRARDFKEAYNRYSETGGLKAIGRDEARRLLARTMKEVQ